MGLFDVFKPNVEQKKERKDIDGLIKVLIHKDSNFRERAALALGEIGDIRASMFGSRQ